MRKFIITLTVVLSFALAPAASADWSWGGSGGTGGDWGCSGWYDWDCY